MNAPKKERVGATRLSGNPVSVKSPTGEPRRRTPRKAATKQATHADEPVREGNTVPVRLMLVEPKAREVFVSGTFNGWSPMSLPLTPDGTGAWSVQLKLAPGRYEYRFVVDGQWVDDPKASRVAPNPFGTLNAVLEVT
jgi:1,4-alpha-glucan branching enzyme